MDLADLIDLEAQLARDRHADPAELERRDRSLHVKAGPGAGRSRRARTRVLSGWLDALRAAPSAPPFPGRRAQSAYRAVRALLVLLGLALGWAAAAALVHGSGREPVNVWDVLLALVGFQVLLFLLLLASFFLRFATTGAPALGFLHGAIAALLRRLGGGAGSATLWHQLRARRSLYSGLEPWLLLSITQSFGVAFNVGVLLALLRSVVFTDVAFAWGTTLVELDTARFGAWVRGMAAPWGWLWPAAVPSQELVEATRYSRLEAAYVGARGFQRAAHPELVGGWWPFLVAAIATYGLLPRAAVLAVARFRARRFLRTLPLDDAEVSRALRRLTEPLVETRGGALPLPAPAAPYAGPAPSGSAPGRCALVLWRDVPDGPGLQAAVAAHAGCEPASVHAAGGRDYDEDAALRWARGAGDDGAVLIVAEAFEAPDRAAVRFLKGLREALGARREVRVVLVDADADRLRAPGPESVALWREGLARLEDPFLAVEPLREVRRE